MTETEQLKEEQDTATAAGESGGNPAAGTAGGAPPAGADGGEATPAGADSGEATAADADNATTAGAGNGEATGGATPPGADSAAATAGDDAVAAAAVVDELADLAQENRRLEQEAQANLDKTLRITAEMDNLRKRVSRDVENAHKYALEKFIKELLPVADSMELGINAAPAADAAALREGMELTLKKFFDCLDKFGVRPIEPLGEKFDPEWHEAVSMQDSEDHEAGLVMAVMQKGYELNGRLLRPAMVVVAR